MTEPCITQTTKKDTEEKPKLLYVNAFPNLSDITLISNEGYPMKSSKLMLARESPVFAIAFAQDLYVKELKLDYTTEAISVALWVLEDSINSFYEQLTLTSFRKTLVFAHAYDIKKVINFCNQEQKKTQLFKAACIVEVLDLLDAAIQLKSNDLIEICVSILVEQRKETLDELDKLDIPASARLAMHALASDEHWRAKFDKELMKTFYNSAFALQGMSYDTFQKKLKGVGSRTSCQCPWESFAINSKPMVFFR